MKQIIAIDFDGTIVEHEFPKIGPLRKNAKEVINRLYEEGFRIVIWTCRTSQDYFDGQHQPTIWHVKEFLDKEGIPYEAINHNVPGLDFEPYPKIYAHIYIDDRQLGGIPDDWEKIYEIIQSDIKRIVRNG